MSEYKDSNHDRHFKLAIPFGAVLTILCVIGLAIGMEFKDAHYNNGDKPLKEWDWSAWDWKDFEWTIYGGLVGQAIQIGIILLLIYIF